MTDTAITLQNSQNIIQEIEQAFYDIPFENSQFQLEHFVIAAQVTPERAYRTIGLQMMSKLQALNTAKFAKLKQDIDLEEIEHHLQDPTLNVFDKKREELKKQEILESQAWNNKLINDTLITLNILYSHFKQLPKYTREDFEQGEKLHFEQKLNRSLMGIEGAKESLINMNEDITALKYLQNTLANLINPTQEQLNTITQSLPNLLKKTPL